MVDFLKAERFAGLVERSKDRARQRGLSRGERERLTLQSRLRSREEVTRANAAANAAFNLNQQLRAFNPREPLTPQEQLAQTLARQQQEALTTSDRPDLIRIGEGPQIGQSAGVPGQLNVFARGQGQSPFQRDILDRLRQAAEGRRLGLRQQRADVTSQENITQATQRLLPGQLEEQKANIEFLKSLLGTRGREPRVNTQQSPSRRNQVTSPRLNLSNPALIDFLSEFGDFQ